VLAPLLVAVADVAHSVQRKYRIVRLHFFIIELAFCNAAWYNFPEVIAVGFFDKLKKIADAPCTESIVGMASTW